MSGIGKVTAIVAVTFMLTSLTLAYMSSEKATDSVVKGIKASQAALPDEAKEDSESTEATSTMKSPASIEANEDSVPGADATLEQTEAPPIQEDSTTPDEASSEPISEDNAQ